MSLLLWSAGAFAFPSDRSAFVATEEREWIPRTAWDSEASSDFVVFQRPIAWENKWLRGERVFDLTTGSISSKQFLTYQRLKIHQPLTEKLEFRFQYLREGDFEQDRAWVPLELKYNFTSKVALSVFGSPALNKSEDDVGLSLYFSPTDEWEWRLSGVWGDYDRNKRKLTADEWSESPFGLTLSSKYLPKENTDDFFQAELHWERPSQRTNAGAVIADLSYESAYTSFQSGRFAGRVLYDRAFASPNARKRSLNQFEYWFIMGPHIVRPGINVFYRETRVGTDQFVYREVLPTVWMQMLPRTRSWGTGIPSVGYDATVFEARHQSASDNDLQHRLNLKYEILFKKAGQLALLFTFDADRPFTGELWEGGAAQFRLDF